MGDRVVDCARLESVCAERHRGFESPPSAICVKRLDPRYLTANWRFGIKCFQNHSRNKYLITPAPAVLRIFFSPANPSRGGVTSGRGHSAVLFFLCGYSAKRRPFFVRL